MSTKVRTYACLAASTNITVALEIAPNRGSLLQLKIDILCAQKQHGEALVLVKYADAVF